MFKCKFCGKEFEKGYQLGAHTMMCKMNPDSRPNKNPPKYVDVVQICPKCGKEFTIHIRKSLYNKGEYPKYCSSFCAHSRIVSDETKEKISKGVSKKTSINECKCDENNEYKFKNQVCKCCGKVFSSNCKTNFCSKECEDKGFRLVCENCGKEFFGRRPHNKYCCKECKHIGIHDKLSMSGRISIQKQGDKRRSKSEILFCKLCEEYFKKVTHNDPIFNGWDADVLIWDRKIAVLWNGKWHYEKITRKHSIKQVQNRDRIKCKEIEKLGWTVYIIKDMGKFNENFVREQFDIFISSLK